MSPSSVTSTRTNTPMARHPTPGRRPSGQTVQCPSTRNPTSAQPHFSQGTSAARATGGRVGPAGRFGCGERPTRGAAHPRWRKHGDQTCGRGSNAKEKKRKKIQKKKQWQSAYKRSIKSHEQKVGTPHRPNLSFTVWIKYTFITEIHRSANRQKPK